MKLIPPFCHKDTPNSERKVFEALRNDKNPLTQNWIVYHSLNYPVSINKSKKVSFKYYGESDFLILAQDLGIIFSLLFLLPLLLLLSVLLPLSLSCRFLHLFFSSL